MFAFAIIGAVLFFAAVILHAGHTAVWNQAYAAGFTAGRLPMESDSSLDHILIVP